MSLRIEDYGLISDCQTVALVGKNGSIDWLCLPRFDSGACLAALLGKRDNGCWRIAPRAEHPKITRRYIPETLVLETEFDCGAEGAVRITDFMPVRTKAADVVRLVEGLRGEVAMTLDLRLAFDYGSVRPWLRPVESGVSAIAGPDKVVLRSPAPVKFGEDGIRAEFTVKSGEKFSFDLTWVPSHFSDPKPLDPDDALERTIEWWKRWSERCTYKGEWRDVVLRSAITLKALTYAPTGGIVAAATTSLPERLGGVRNWDYRYCWVRDAAFTLFALLNCGYREEAREWRDWLLRATAGHPAQLQMLYGVAGERRLTELELKWLSGYEQSKPVRIGNAAVNQFQLDVFGETVDVVHQMWDMDDARDEFGWELEEALLEFLEGAWQKPDEGIWEVRGPRRNFTHSKLMAWVAFDRCIRMAEKSHLNGKLDRWRETRHAIHTEICEKAFNHDLGAFTQFYGSKLMDASVLRMPLVGFLPAADPRIRGTVKMIEERLLQDGFIRRYENTPEVDGLPQGEGAFLMCTLWYVDVLWMLGEKKRAREVFERVLNVRNDLGLLSESYDTQAERLVGNFPQAFSHVGLINAALRLSGAESEL